jgi:hypothetical protein
MYENPLPQRFTAMRRLLLLLLFFLPLAAVAGDGDLVASPVVMELVNTPRQVPADWRERSGAVSLNHDWEKNGGEKWYIELQRDGGRWVEAGVAHRNRDAIEWGLKQLQWGFAQMKPDGSFACDDAFHSTSFLIETASRSILLIESSAYAEELKPQVAALKPPLLKGALWMISLTNFKAAESQRIYGHRRFLVGCGLLQTGIIHGHAELMQVARYFIEDGIRLQRADGAFPEMGGHDSSYHAVSLIYLQRILLTAPDESAKARMEPSGGARDPVVDGEDRKGRARPGGWQYPHRLRPGNRAHGSHQKRESAGGGDCVALSWLYHWQCGLIGSGAQGSDKALNPDRWGEPTSSRLHRCCVWRD